MVWFGDSMNVKVFSKKRHVIFFNIHFRKCFNGFIKLKDT